MEVQLVSGLVTKLVIQILLVILSFADAAYLMHKGKGLSDMFAGLTQ